MELKWRTSSRSGGNDGGDCVEVGEHCGACRVLVRDSKDRLGPVLAFERESWRAFVDSIRAGELAPVSS